MKYLDAQLQSKRMGCFCKWCNRSHPLGEIAQRLGTRTPWMADHKYRRAFARMVATHLRECTSNDYGKPMDVANLREQVG